MSFITDKQTLDDLNIFGRPGKDSVFSVFNKTSSRGSAERLEQIFLYPLSDAKAIQKRAAIFKYFSSLKIEFPFNSEMLDTAEHYLSNTDERSRLNQENRTLGSKLNNFIGADTGLQLLSKGVTALTNILHRLDEFINRISEQSAVPAAYLQEINEIKLLLHDVVLRNRPGKLSFQKIAEYDKLLRFSNINTVRKLLSYIYDLDIYLTIARVAAERNFVFPEILSDGQHSVHIKGLYHPLLNNPVGNTISITPEKNIIFLTGANMAGKSTFMKSLGIAMFLAHIGFPVPAEKMQFSVRDGIFTTINLPDDLGMGYSHFYAEVLRVKKVAEELRRSKNLFIIFDELFRGTNVKDAYEATVAITAAYAKKTNCMFVVSTHIIEAGEDLKRQCDNINFVYMPTIMQDGKPLCTYMLKQGITADRHGMVIINNEKIIEIIRSRKNKLLQHA